MNYIVVSGNSGAGKSTLLREVAIRFLDKSAVFVDERSLHHSRLVRMFQAPKVWALPVQLHFVTARASKLLECVEDPTTEAVVMERSLSEDELFFEHYVRLGAIPEELTAAYRSLLSSLRSLVPEPQMFVHLKAQPGTLATRLRQAENNGEREVELSGSALDRYLVAMESLYEEWASTMSKLPTYKAVSTDYGTGWLAAATDAILRAISRG